MEIYHSIEKFQSDHRPINLTIGNFDGVHKGHQAVIKHLLQLEGRSVVITFTNHPSEILRPSHTTPLLCTLPHKIKLLEELGVDTLITIPFTHQFSQQTAETFIAQTRKFIPFSSLVLGHDAVLGKDRQGNKKLLNELAKIEKFQITYLEEYQEEGLPVSSTRIRQLVQQKNFTQASKLLGRPYSIYAKIDSPDIQKLCLPPAGTYPVSINIGGKFIDELATITDQQTLKLSKIYKDNIEIIF